MRPSSGRHDSPTACNCTPTGPRCFWIGRNAKRPWLVPSRHESCGVSPMRWRKRRKRNTSAPVPLPSAFSNEDIMSTKNLEDLAKDMAGIDIAILSTHTDGGQIANRPMSNNGDVSYDGTSYYFTYERARTVSDIQKDPKVALGFSSK